jgi:1,4-dihydroxy-2-naphthoate polyprenyltransferase
VANNLRDIPTSGKTTLAVRLGDSRTRILHLALVAVPVVATIALAFATPWALLGLFAVPLAARANTPVRSGARGPALIPALRDAGLAMLVWSFATAVALVV